MSLVDALARFLDTPEREAVLGDFAESGETGVRAFLDLAGLVARRQGALWRDWKPWLGALAVALPAGLVFCTASQWVASRYGLYAWIASNYRVIDPAALAETGLSLDRGVLQIVRASLVLLAWTFVSGFTIGSLSRRAAWVNGLLFSVALVYGPIRWALHERSLDPDICATVAAVLLSVYLGMRLSHRASLRPSLRALLWAAAMATALAAGSSFWFPMSTGWRAGLVLVTYGPAVYLTAASIWAF